MIKMSMQKPIAVFLLFLLSLQVAAAPDCEKLAEFQLELEVHSANLANAKTTRVPAGGPYQYREVVCTSECTVEEKSLTLERYRPDHPDADEDGLVLFPDIDKEREKDLIAKYAQAFSELKAACQTKQRL